MAAQLVIALLALASLASASELDCKELIKPLVLDDHSPIYGKWIMHMGTYDHEGLRNDLVSVSSSWVEMSASAETHVLSVNWADRVNGTCMHGVANGTVSDAITHATFTINGHTSFHDWKYFETCPDCLMSEDTTMLPDDTAMGRYFYLFTRTGKLDAAHVETVKKQAKCLNFVNDFHFMGEDHCPDTREPAAATEKPAVVEDSSKPPE
ncbi:uncharacterized protein LOC128761999 [Synchiropus splendidus]|uniref:uncharacterized protein LOC128761999 n=1 Tax=Synchiropus splendidus TaxID=270530 RepID=UPI00237ED03E|nr:uncharacterized protein LOC128761999 [Synchiropus splendidus]